MSLRCAQNRLQSPATGCTGQPRVGNWKEVGSLNLSFKGKGQDTDSDSASWVIEPVSNFKIGNVESLIYEDQEVFSECGIALGDERDGEIIVAAGVSPGSVSISVPFSSCKFQPEFEVAKYQRFPI